MHVQWLEHGTGILFEELAGEQQLYLCDLCDTIPLTDLVTKVRVRFGKPDAAHPLPKGEYYYRSANARILPTASFELWSG